MSNILVTGGAGFIGSHLVDKLVSLEHKVTVLDNLSSGKLSNINKYYDFFTHDINDSLYDIFNNNKFDYVFHLAAFINLRNSIKNPTDCFYTNVLGSINLIEYCVKYNCKLIFSSTGGAIYSPNTILPWTENSLADPQSPYGLSKLHIEQYLKIAKILYNLNYTILRYSNVYGERQDAQGEAGVISVFLNDIKNNKNLKIFGDGCQTRDFINVNDVVAANIAVMKLDNCETYNVSSNSEISINNLANILLTETKSNLKIDYLPSIIGEVKKTKLSYEKLKNIIGWEPKFNFNDGLKKLIL